MSSSMSCRWHQPTKSTELPSCRHRFAKSPANREQFILSGANPSS
jgi:hypothetical protein